MNHSPKFEKVKSYYNDSLWDEKRVRDAVKKGWITSDEFEEITGKSYYA